MLVTDAERGSALAIIRGLGRAGWEVVAGGTHPHSPAFRSRYVGRTVRYPAPERDADAYADALLTAVRRLEVDLVIPVTDAAIVPISTRRADYEAVTTVAIPDHDALERARDKQATVELAASIGVPVPASRAVRTVEAAVAAADRLGYPVVLKPFRSRSIAADGTIESFVVSYARDAGDVAARMAPLEGRTTVVMQGYAVGAGMGIGVLADRGSVILAFQHRRIHEVPITGGASALRESVPLDRTLLRHAEALMGALGWTGLAMIEFKVGPEGPCLMEINGRPWGSLPLAVAAGVDFPGRLASLYLGGRSHRARAPLSTGPDTRYRVGLRARDLGLEVAWIGSVLAAPRRYGFLPVPSRLEGLTALAGLFDPRVRTDSLALDDPAPGLADIVRIARHVAGKVRSRAR